MPHTRDMNFYSILNPNAFNVRDGVAEATVYKSTDAIRPVGYLTDEDMHLLADAGRIVILSESGKDSLQDRYNRVRFTYRVVVG